jgi:predicted alpha/beta superfamily hydrolase
MKKAFLAILVVVVSAVSAGAIGGGVAMALVRQANPQPERIQSEREVAVASEALGEPMTLSVRLPADYDADPERRYPVLWVTDGTSHLDHAAHTAHVLATVGIGEPTIVVAVPSSSPGRAFDFVPEGMGEQGGGADRFLSFLVGEARAAIEDRYRTDGRNLLFGHSLGGLFVTWAMTRDPEAFDGWLASSPSFWVGDGSIESSLRALLEADPAPRTVYFTSLGSEEGNEMARYFDRVEALLEAEAGPGWPYTSEITPAADHGTNPRLSLPSALDAWWSAAPANGVGG